MRAHVLAPRRFRSGASSFLNFFPLEAWEGVAFRLFVPFCVLLQGARRAPLSSSDKTSSRAS
jgi:hypothetical protein